jgi:hypothetical protein
MHRTRGRHDVRMHVLDILRRGNGNAEQCSGCAVSAERMVFAWP